MYYTAVSTSIPWKGKLLQASPVDGIPNHEPHWWLCKPLTSALPRMKFRIDTSATLPDNYWTGSIFDLYSQRLVETLRDVGIYFETFPTDIVDAATGQIVPVDYQIFHLLDMYPVSMIRAKDESGKVVSVKVPKLMFRLEKYIERVVVHEELKRMLDENGITGFEYRPFK
jgi:hypothetical protein